MYLPQSYLVAVVLMFITMLCWGSWANTAKMDKSWRFELFYLDYSIGVFLGALVFAWTLGSLGDSGPSFWANLKSINFIDRNSVVYVKIVRPGVDVGCRRWD